MAKGGGYLPPAEFGQTPAVPFQPAGHAFEPFNAGYDHGGGPGSGFNLFQLLSTALQYRWLIFAFTLVSLVGGLLFTALQTPKYRATSKMEILVPGAKIFQDMQVVGESNDLRAFQTASEKIQSRTIAERVVYSLNLTEKPRFLSPPSDIALTNLIRRAFGADFRTSTANMSAADREQRAIAIVLANLSVALVRNTAILEIGYSDPDPKMAEAIANQIAQSFIDQKVDQTSEMSGLARDFIKEQVLQVKQKLQTSEQELVAYAKKEGLTIDDKNSSFILTSIGSINDALSRAVQERLDKGRWVAQIDAGNGASLPSVIGSEGLRSMRERIAELRATYQQKLGAFKPAYPEMVQLAAQIRELENQVKQAVTAISNATRLEFEDAKAKEAELRAKLAELESQQSDFQDRNIQYTILKREVDSNRSQYESLIGKLNQVGVGSELKNDNAQIVDKAIPPERPYSPHLPLNIGVSLAFALALSAGAIYLTEMMNNTFTVPDQIEKELGLPVLGILPLAPGDAIAAARNETHVGLSEAYRSLRTALQFSRAEGAPKTLLVTSSEASEGKSITAYMLAKDFGLLDKKVLVIDADLRKPRMHRMFDESNTLGLSNLLTAAPTPDDIRKTLKKTNLENVYLLTSGTLPPNPADLLSSAKMAHLMVAFSERFDMIIIDSPPVIGLADAPVLSRLTESVLMVVSCNQVPRKAASHSLKRIRSTGAHVVGACLTKFVVKKFDYNYSYGYISSAYYDYESKEPTEEGTGAPEPEAIKALESEAGENVADSETEHRIHRSNDPDAGGAARQS
ncbi:GumC family protein [Hansschlegelia plantiphila]|uniref:non-specific protein-tyrosine kinase n=1 Tax=Hansschlegelia plantiphila TaxID=374655 RepID=A0A9W6MX53_9HYPH|nr:polysaccharide biosynthesis tyrosine autokinase [Hansschlegelia plantiphila]GLK69718.1 hypothetical protein GCM10008179_33560 [Hansschlegelia plantiphila]